MLDGGQYVFCIEIDHPSLLGLTGVDVDDGNAAFDFPLPQCPYPGLNAFQETDAAVFFGRENEIARIRDVLMRPDRGCVGELRDPEAAYTYVSECMTGHPGSPSTIHGRDAPKAATRLFNLFRASDSGKSYSDDMIRAQLALAVDVIVPFRERGGTYEIAEVWLAPEAERRG